MGIQLSGMSYNTVVMSSVPTEVHGMMVQPCRMAAWRRTHENRVRSLSLPKIPAYPRKSKPALPMQHVLWFPDALKGFPRTSWVHQDGSSR
jgi:hypothetical protein